MNFCKNCGASLERESNFCVSCGTPVEKEQTIETSAALEAGPPPQTQTQEPKGDFKPNRFLAFLKKPIVIILIILLIGGASTAAILLNHSPKELYLLSEYKTFQKGTEEIEARYGKSIDFQEKLLETPYEAEYVLSGDINVPSAEGLSDYDMIKEILGAISIQANTKVDPVNQLGQVGLSLNLENETALDFELYQTKEQMGVKVPVLYDKYFYINFDQFGEAMSLLDPYYSGPETLELSDLRIQDFEFTEEEVKHLKDTYSTFLLEHLSDDSFTLEKGVDYNHNGESMKLKAITLTLSEQEVKAFINQFSDQLIQDDQLQNMILDRVEKMHSEVMLAAGEEIEFDREEMKKELEDGLKDVKEELDYVTFPNGFKSTILIDKNEQIVDRQVEFAVADDEGDYQQDFELTTKNVPYGKNKTWKEFIFTSTNVEWDEVVTLKYSNDVQAGKNGSTENMKVDFVVDEGDYSEGIQFSMNSEFKGKDGNQEIQRDFEFNNDIEYSDMGTFTGDITQISNVSDRSSEDKFAITLNYEDDYDSGSVTFNLDSNTKLVDKVDISNLNAESNDGLNVVDLTEEDLYEISEEVTINLYDLVEKLGIPLDDYFYDDSYYSDSYYDDSYYDEAYYDDTEYYDEDWFY